MKNLGNIHIENEWKYMEMEPVVNVILDFYDHNDFGIKLSVNNNVDLFGVWIFDENFVGEKSSYNIKFTMFGFSLVI